MIKCDECGCIHGAGNLNRLCPKASNYDAGLAASLAADSGPSPVAKTMGEALQMLAEAPDGPNWFDPREALRICREQLGAANARIAELEANQEKVLRRADFFQREHRKALDETFKVCAERAAGAGRVPDRA